jgi:hypothetical protein
LRSVELCSYFVKISTISRTRDISSSSDFSSGFLLAFVKLGIEAIRMVAE